MNKLVPAICAATVAGLAGVASADHVDGVDIPTGGYPLLATQNSPTQFGNATGGGQDSAGGSELNQLFGDIRDGTLYLGLTGNLEANFNKLWIFLDGVDGGEMTLANDNLDGGFGEINNLAGLQFDVAMDHGFRFEVGDGFLGVNAFDLIDNTAYSVVTGGGPGSLPLDTAMGSNGNVIVGWDNSNILGVDGTSAAGAATATTGIELSVDLLGFLGSVPDTVNVTAFISNGDGSFLSNQVLPGANSAGNIGSPSGVMLNSVAAVAVPEPTSLALLGLGGIAALRRRR